MLPNDLELNSPPKDGISSINFANTCDDLLVSSWDANVYLYDTVQNKLKEKVPFDAAQLDSCFGSNDTVSFTGGLDRQVMRIDWNTLKVSLLGTHEDAIKSLVRCRDSGMLFSGSWDSSVTAWDTVSAKRITKMPVQGKVYSMDCVGNILAVALSGRHVILYDTRKLEEGPLQTRESSLRHQTRCIRLFPNAEAFAISSIEGRVGIEYVDPESQGKNFAFKCHRAPAPGQENVEMVYPVNALAFNPKSGFCCTGGSDGIVSVWNPQTKRRIRSFPKKDSSISSLSFNKDGSALALASSYCFEEGEKDHAPDSIYIKSMNE